MNYKEALAKLRDLAIAAHEEYAMPRFPFHEIEVLGDYYACTYPDRYQSILLQRWAFTKTSLRKICAEVEPFFPASAKKEVSLYRGQVQDLKLFAIPESTFQEMLAIASQLPGLQKLSQEAIDVADRIRFNGYEAVEGLSVENQIAFVKLFRPDFCEALGDTRKIASSGLM